MSEHAAEGPAPEGPGASLGTSGELTPSAVAEPPPQEPSPEAAAVPTVHRSARDRITALRRAQQDKKSIEGKVIGWNRGGLHVAIEDQTTAFCPRSEIEIGEPRHPKNYLDKTYSFRVLKIDEAGRRIVLSRAAELRGRRARVVSELRDRLRAGTVVTGSVSSLADFGAFVDLGGVKGLVHVSEISRERVKHPSQVLEVGQQVKVKILKIQEGGKRISLSIKALQPDPWKGVARRYPEGAVVRGTVERTNRFGAFILLETGVTGLLPASEMLLPRDASPPRVYPPGKEVQVQVVSVRPRQRRITLAPEGAAMEGTRSDYQAYLKGQQRDDSPSGGFNALEAAFKKIK